MSGRRTLWWVAARALIGAGGIVGMLLVDGGVGDGLLFLLAASPLLHGWWRWQRSRP
ncbi:hypothetical protein [Solimonas soli]|uniref:hypothetical protein n=1 Tax=Solimonas soli TaxID=413479 RepID=UPI0004ADF209|nr:hypothetical protein [Solimonas soli]